MQVVILAAGLGLRLDPLTQQIPKCLVEVNGTPIIINALKNLTRYKLSRIVIVIGHLGDTVKNKLGKSFNGVPIEYVKNTVYDKTNNVYSLWLARKYLDQDTLLMEGDVYFEAKAVTPLFSEPVQNIALLDHAQSYTDGTMVEINENLEIHKMIPARDQGADFNYAGKYKTVNIYSFTKAYLKDIFLPTLNVYIKTQGREAYYELIIGALIFLGRSKIKAVLVKDAKWVEIDDFVDLERAENLFIKPTQLYKKVDQVFGGYWKYDFSDFSYLYNLYFPAQPLLKELQLNMKKLICNYPSGQKELIEKLANWVKIDARYLAIGNGASELISILKRTALKRMTIPVPTFNEYHDDLKNDQVNYYYTEPNDFILDLDAFIKSINKSKSNIAVLINPDLPSGQLLEPKDIVYLLKKLSHLDAFILDESFIDFSFTKDTISLLPKFEKYKNLVIIHSLSKELGVPGLRLGYAASANTKIIKNLQAEVPIWNINGMAEYFLTILPKYRKVYQESCKKVMQDRNYFFNKLLKIKDIKAYKSSGNYILVKLTGKQKSDALKKHLFVHDNILIKDCSNKKGLEEKKYIRLAVRTKSEIDAFIPKFITALNG